MVSPLDLASFPPSSLDAWNPWAGSNYSASNPHHMELKNLYKPVLGGNHWNPAWGHIWEHVCKLVPIGSVLGEQNCLGPIVQKTGVRHCACPYPLRFCLDWEWSNFNNKCRGCWSLETVWKGLTFQASGSLSWKLRSYNVTNVTMKWLVSGPSNLQQSNTAMENHNVCPQLINSSTHL